MEPTAKPKARKDAFPDTMRTWLGEQLGGDRAGLQSAREHIMRVYSEPLSVYIRGSSFRTLDDADDLVRGFFADRLSRDLYLQKWKESERPLRFWLIVGLKHYLLEEARRRRRDQHALLPDESPGADHDGGSDRAYLRAVAIEVVREAISRAAQGCQTDGLDDHWMVFRRHQLGGESYARIAEDMKILPSRASVMARTAATRFRAALLETVGWDGATSTEIEEELRSLMEATGR